MQTLRHPRPVLSMIGGFFRKMIGSDAGAADLRGRHPCALCGEPTDPAAREWSPHLRAYVDAECVPSVVRSRGERALAHWLDTGKLRSMEDLQTDLRTQT